MHEQPFSHAAAPAPCVVLFLPLKPYSIGHENELWRQNNPLLTGTLEEFQALPAVEQSEWLIRAVDFCSQNHAEWAENEAILASKPRFWQISARRRQRLLEKTWREWEKLIATVKISAEAVKFRNYLMAQRVFPPAPEERVYNLAQGRDDAGGGRALGSPIVPRLLNFLASKPALLAGYQSIYDFPISLAAWLYFTEAEIAGMSAIENQAERDIVAKEKQLMDEIEAERAAEKLKETPCQP